MSSLTIKSHITLNVSRPNNNVVVYAKQFDKDSRTVDIKLVDGASVWDPPENCEMVVMYTKPDGKLGVYDQLEDNSTPAVTRIGTGEVLLTLAEQALTVAGNVLVEISFYTADLRSTTLSFMLSVESAVPKNEVLESDNYFNILSELIQGLLGATTNPPQIDSVTKNWMLWNQTLNRYEVSDHSSVGTKGDKGDQGWSIVSVTKTGGTGAEGTVDTYTMRNNNPSTSQQVVGTFNVYNGRDGSGAKGSRVPLADGGTGSAGELETYSSEDHQHPLNTSDSDTVDIGSSSPGEASTYARSDHSHGYGDLFNLVYPIGSIYISVSETDPSMLFGGEWAPIDGRMLIGAGSTYPVNSTGGAATKTLSLTEIPAHTHGNKSLSGTFGIRHSTNGGSVASGSGIVSISQSAATSYTRFQGEGTSAKGDLISINATHQHDSVGGGRSFSIMPPYLAVYMWQRIA